MSDAPDGDKLLLKPAEAARRLSISPRHLVTLVQAGEIRIVRAGRLILFRPADLVEWIDRAAAAPYEKRPANNPGHTEAKADG